MRKNACVGLWVALVVLLASWFAGCSSVPYTKATVATNDPKDLKYYATIIALRKRSYFIDQSVTSLDTGKIRTKRRQHETGKFWWVLNCDVNEGIEIAIDSNLVKGDTMHRRARHWVEQIKSDTQSILVNYPADQIRNKGKEYLDNRELNENEKLKDTP